jgi:aquaporin Z
MDMTRRCFAEALGTAWLVLGGCGSAVIAAKFIDTPGVNLGIGFVGVAFAFGLTVLTMAYAIGHVSGCHLNPAVTLGLVAGGRFKPADAVPYILAQVVGALIGAAVLYVIASGQDGFSATAGGFATNGYAERSPGKYSMPSCFLAEAAFTFMFVVIIHGATDARAPKGFAPIAIGLGLTLIVLIGIPVTNLSVNPARSTGPAAFAGPAALEQLWLFWAAPILGAVLAGLTYRFVLEAPKA